MISYESYFTEELPSIIKSLKEEDNPSWGEMSSLEMLEHLRVAIEMCLDDIPREITTPEEKLEAFRRFLMSEKPFMQNAPKPAAFNDYPEKNGDINKRKMELLKAVVKMMAHFERYPEFSSIHPSFGRLNVDQWKQLHKKHFTHHFTQFGLV